MQVCIDFLIFLNCFIIYYWYVLVVKDCGDIAEHNKMTVVLEKIKSLASSHPINSSTFDLGMCKFVIYFKDKKMYKK